MRLVEKSARFGFGLSTLLFGAISLAWHGSDLWLHSLKLAGAFAAVPAWACATLLCGGGLLLLLGRGALGSASAGLGGLLLAFSCIADIAPAPASFPSYIDFFEFSAIVCGAAALNATSRRSARLAAGARIAFGICTISFAVAQLYFFSYTASLIPRWIPGASLWTALTTLAFGLAAVAMLIARRASLALDLEAAMLALFALLVWVPRLLAAASFDNASEFVLSCVIAAAASTIARADNITTRRASIATRANTR